MAGQVPATHEHRLSNRAPWRATVKNGHCGSTQTAKPESGAASRAIGDSVVMGGRDLPGHYDLVF